jgi:hypothetical protein
VRINLPRAGNKVLGTKEYMQCCFCSTRCGEWHDSLSEFDRLEGKQFCVLLLQHPLQFLVLKASSSHLRWFVSHMQYQSVKINKLGSLNHKRKEILERVKDGVLKSYPRVMVLLTKSSFRICTRNHAIKFFRFFTWCEDGF